MRIAKYIRWAYMVYPISFYVAIIMALLENEKWKIYYYLVRKNHKLIYLSCVWTQEVTMWNFINEHTNTRKKWK
jgi:hypothetical protein